MNKPYRSWLGDVASAGLSDVASVGRPGTGPPVISRPARRRPGARHQVAEGVQRRLRTARNRCRARREVPAGQRRHLGQERSPELVVLQDAVPARAAHGAAAAAVEDRSAAGSVTSATPWWIRSPPPARRTRGPRPPQPLPAAEPHPRPAAARAPPPPPARSHRVHPIRRATSSGSLRTCRSTAAKPGARLATASARPRARQPGEVGDGGPYPRAAPPGPCRPGLLPAPRTGRARWARPTARPRRGTG